ncbi:hypothetical protein [Mesorhizobium sp. 1M-11]|uniref:hypothetical protein n=1 Tax=Mesorhizobium sp. 1M-11 TaxID=1529006 RepID=UPI0006C75839|nr:hypothetical protein [Mesorhizobium sp. 1M-11]
MFNWLQIGAGAALGALVAFGPAYAYLYGKREGRQQAAVTALEATVKALHDRVEINASISTADAVDLCRDFGLSVDQADECVRRLREADAKP